MKRSQRPKKPDVVLSFHRLKLEINIGESERGWIVHYVRSGLYTITGDKNDTLISIHYTTMHNRMVDYLVVVQKNDRWIDHFKTTSPDDLKRYLMNQLVDLGEF